MKQVLSLGGGIQSTALLLMSLHDEIDPPCEAAVFADTGWERGATYANIERLTEYASGFGVEVITTSSGNIRAEMLAEGDNHDNHMPLFTDAGNRRAGQLRRQCTGHYKIAAIRRELRKRFGFQNFVQWIGFSVDEALRMKPSDVQYITHRYPLIEKRLGRDSCFEWLLAHGFDVPVKSACIGCPYRTNAEWNAMRRDAPGDFADACAFDDAIRAAHLSKHRRKDFPLYLHASMQPLREISFMNAHQLDLFQDQVCGDGCWT